MLRITLSNRRYMHVSCFGRKKRPLDLPRDNVFETASELFVNWTLNGAEDSWLKKPSSLAEVELL